MIKQTSGMREERRREKLKALLDRLDKRQQAAVYNDCYTKQRAFYKLLVLFRRDEIAQALQRLVNYSRITISKSIYIFRALAEEESVKHELKLTTFANYFEGKCLQSKQQIFRSIALMKFRFPLNLIIRRLHSKLKHVVHHMRAENKRANLANLLQTVTQTFEKKAILKYAAFSEIKLRAVLVKSKIGSGLERLRHLMEKNELVKKSRLLSDVKSKEVLRQKTNSLCSFLQHKVAEKMKTALALIHRFGVFKRANQRAALCALAEVVTRRVLEQQAAGFSALRLPAPSVLEPVFRLLEDKLRARRADAFTSLLVGGFRRAALLSQLVNRMLTKQAYALSRLRRCRLVRAARSQRLREGLVRVSRALEPNFYQAYKQLRSGQNKKSRFSSAKLPLTAHFSPLYFPFRVLAKIADKKDKAVRLLFALKELAASRKARAVAALARWVQLKAACTRLDRLMAGLARRCKVRLFDYFRSIAMSQLRAADNLASALCALMMKKKAAGYHSIRLFDLRIDVRAIVTRAVDDVEACFRRQRRVAFSSLVAESKAQTYRMCYTVIWDKLWMEKLQSKLKVQKATVRGKLDRLLNRSKLPACLARIAKYKKEEHFALIRLAGKARLLKTVEKLVRKAERSWRRNSIRLLHDSLDTQVPTLQQKLSLQSQLGSPSRLVYFARLNKTLTSLLLDRLRLAFSRMLTMLRFEMQEKNSQGTLSTRLSSIEDTLDRLSRKKLVRIHLDKTAYGSSSYHG